MQVYNTLGRARQQFEPQREGKVGMYICGATVQSSPHLGHGRYAVVFDVMRRYLTWRGYEVTYVTNITDVEDKIIAEAQRRGVEIQDVVDEATEHFVEGYQKLGVLEPDHMPRASEHIDEMIELISRLIEAGHAYDSDGDVYFAVRSYDDYGKLSGRNIEDMLAGARVDPGEHKRDPLDFALWKAAKPGEPTWDSPWGPGRPGWHIECSVMAAQYLGDSFDIHGGGEDLIFPHHENEVAQSEAVTGVPFATYWLHNGMLNLAGEKMAKSTGRIVGLLDVLEEHPPLAVRLFYLRKRYREQFDFTPEAVRDAAAQLERLWSFRRRFEGERAAPDAGVIEAFRAAMDDDFNTASALGALFDAVREGNRLLDTGEDAGAIVGAYDEIMGVLGLAEVAAGLDDLAAELAALAGSVGVVATGAASSDVDALLVRRNQARAQREFAVADRVRNELAALGIQVEDTADGSRWHRR